MAETFHVAILLFPGVTQLDFTGPLEVLQRVPGLHADLAWKSLEPVECAARTIGVPPVARMTASGFRPSSSASSVSRSSTPPRLAPTLAPSSRSAICPRPSRRSACAR